MKVYATLSSKGQITVPAKVRKELGLKEGDTLEVHSNPFMHSFQFSKVMPISELHKMNQAILKRNKTSLKDYRSGDGFKAHVARKYGA